MMNRAVLSNFNGYITWEHIVHKTANGVSVDLVNTVYKGAFDLVNAIRKLTAYGMHGRLLNWIMSFLCTRRQFTSISRLSGYRDFLGALWPLLFMIFFNDIVWEMNYVNILLFVDDLKIYRHLLKIFLGCILKNPSIYPAINLKNSL